MAAIGELVHAARLDGAGSQHVFRALLDSLARPGTTVALRPPGPGVPAVLLPALALADVEVGIHVVGDGTWTELLVIATGATGVPLELADIVVAPDGATADIVRRMRRGSALQPEDGGRLCVAGTAATAVEIEGPGVPELVQVLLPGLSADAVDALAEVNAGFPAGIDVHAVHAGGVISIPRSTRLEVC